MSAPVVLVHPPQAKACEPPSGLPALAGHLMRQGVPVRLVDANLRVQEALLSEASLATGAQRLRDTLGPGPAATSARRAAARAEAVLEALRRPATYADPGEHRRALARLAEAYRAASRARGVRISPSDLEVPGWSPLSARDLIEAARQPERTGLGPELEGAAAEILRSDPALVGVSATFLSQALPSFALAGLLRRAGFRGRLVLGGGLVGSWAGRLRPDSPIFRIWDALVAGPGEEALAGLAAGRPPPALPGVMAPGAGAWLPRGTGARPAVCFRPSFDGLPWSRYWAPGPILPLATSRGCYWRRCAFCPEAAQDGQPFRMASPEELADTLARSPGGPAPWAHLTDDAVPPRMLRQLARADAGARWYGFARLEKAFLDPGFARELAGGGCAMLQLGVESASQRLLDAMGKGTRVAEAEAILAHLAAAGIRTYVYLLFGLPSETPAEAEHTLAWAARNAASITFLNLSLFHRPRGSRLDPRPAAGHAPCARPEDEDRDLSLYWGHPEGERSRRRALRTLLRDARNDPVLGPILARTPEGLTSNHAAFAPL
ncbi:MAG: radical SAM protein [Deferrisomatales bacterium]